MGKPKKGKKGQKDDDFGDDGVDIDPLAQGADDMEADEPVKQPAAAKKGKKGRRKKDDDWEDDVALEIAALSLDNNKGQTEENGEQEEIVVNQPKQKKKDKKKKKKNDFDDDDEDDDDDDIMAFEKSAPTKKNVPMSAFQMLDMGDDDDDDDESEEEEEAPQPVKKNKQKKTQKQDSVENKSEDEEEKPKQQTNKQQKKKQKGKSKKADADEEDLDALLAEIESKPQPQQGKKAKKGKKQVEDETEAAEVGGDEAQTPTEPPKEDPGHFQDLSSMTQDEIAKMLGDDDDEEEDKKAKKKKNKKKQEAAGAEEEDKAEGDEEQDGEDEDEGGTVKTAAQKKKEKRERQKQQKLQEKSKGKKKEEKKEAASEDKVEASTPVVEAAEVKPDEDDEGEQEDGKKKKDRKKKKKGEEKEEKKKKPSKMVAALQEALQKQKEEEERLLREEEEKERKREEAFRLKQEQEQREREKKEREKQKKKERIDKLKAEGKYLTPKQKEAQKRAQQMLEAMKAQGLDVPATTSAEGEEKPKKRVVYSKKKKQPQNKENNIATSPTEESAPATPGERDSPEVEEQAEVVEEKKDEEPADAWDAEEEVKDTWDVESEGEEEAEEKPAVNKQAKKAAVKAEEEDKEEDSEDEDSEEEDEDDDDDDSEDESEDESSEDDDLTPAERLREKTLRKIEKRKEAAEAKRTTDHLRAPVVVVLGHVDTGKTKILDKLRRTNVQDGEAGGITQQIGATNVPDYCVKEQTKMVKEFAKQELKIPGLLIIDTPGHESFSNLRSRGSNLCDIAILVVDIMHGLEPQTIESINLLKARKTPFVIALNKIDRLFQWQPNPHNDVVNTIKKQKPNTKIEFEERTQVVITQMAEQGMNACLFYENKNPREYLSLVPTSAHSGDGMGNLIALICELTQTMLAKKLAYSEYLQANVMEVKALPGLGTTIDVILINGKIKEGDTIVVAGTEGPIVTQIRGLLMPQPMRELRVKSAYVHHKEVLAAQGVKLIAKDLDKSLAGLPLHVANDDEEAQIYREELSEALKEILAGIRLQERGVFVQASTLGSLEALLEFLRTSKIPYAGINIGPVHKKDIMKASVMLEHDIQYAVILAFDVKVEREAQEMAESVGVKIFTADIIYHLFDAFMNFREELKRKRQEEHKHEVVFPCKCRIVPNCVFKSRDPIVIGVSITAGFLKKGTPLCVPGKEFIEIGVVSSMEINHKEVDKAMKGQEVCIKIENTSGDAPKMVGRHFDESDLLCSKISRNSIDILKNYFRDEMTKADWQLILELKKQFEIL